MFDKILIANRGEIACRIIRTARRLGVRTVAVYSTADAKAMHVAMADEARLIGPPPPRESYLSIPRILEAARASGAQAIHPGYGFLSENADFAQACVDAGLVFIGPSANSMRAMGDKANAKALMARAGIPIVPGYHGEDQDEARFAAEAERVGFPVLIKAAAGGGGRGMRVVAEPTALAAALDSARREAGLAFGQGRLILEKYVDRPRHIEVQVFGDCHGNLVHLFERDCSAQRRHQKVIEQAPAPDLDEALRRTLGATAVAAAKAADYAGAGTVEFILKGRDFYFIEMNTRLQVEHPVTEMITGHDLVEWQLKVAAGEALPVRQEQISCRGCAIEARLYAEDPAHDFAPASGPLRTFKLPAPAADLRIETGMREGDEVPIFYDALLAKLIAWSTDREGACRRLADALEATEIGGIATNRDLLVRLARLPDLCTGELDTGFIERHRAALTVPLTAAPFAALAAASLALLEPRPTSGGPDADAHSPWNLRDGWQLVGESSYELQWLDAGLERRLGVRFGRSGISMTLDDTTAEVRRVSQSGAELCFELSSEPITAGVQRHGRQFDIAIAGHRWILQHLDPFARRGDAQSGPAALVAPVHGRVLEVAVSDGRAVKRGELLMLLECMKLEYRVVAPADGVVEALHYAAGDVVEDGAQLLTFTRSG